jgi:hypothetical protein
LEFLKKIFGSRHETAPAKVTSSLSGHFMGATSIEWSWHHDLWEAIFFHEEITKMARFSNSGKLLEYRVNIEPDLIPSPIMEAASQEWEIMNCIAVYSSTGLTYELIVRDSDLIRYQLWIDSLGNRIRFDKL